MVLRKVYCYPDAKTDDHALTRRVVEEFQAAGGKVLVHCKVEEIEWTEAGFVVKSSAG